MLCVDTNILLRLLVEIPEDLAQCRSARKAVADAGQLRISQVVLVELVWTLRRLMHFDKAALITTLRVIELNAAFLVPQRERFVTALLRFEQGPADFADYLIAAEAAESGAELLSFDRKLKGPGVRVLKA